MSVASRKIEELFNPETLAMDMVDGCMISLKDIFFKAGKYAPIIRWVSKDDENWPTPHKLLGQYCFHHDTIDRFDAKEFARQSPKALFSYLFQIIKNGADYQYGYVGENASDFLKVDPQSNQTIPLIKNDILQQFCKVELIAIELRGQGIQVLQQEHTQTEVLLWNKVIFPIFDHNTGKVHEFWGCILRVPPPAKKA